MPAPRTWTDGEIKRLQELNGSVPAEALASEFGCCRSALIEKEHRLGIRRNRLASAPIATSKYHPLPPFPRDWQPLPAGHPETWGLLTRGTVLDGTAWPDQVVSL